MAETKLSKRWQNFELYREALVWSYPQKPDPLKILEYLKANKKFPDQSIKDAKKIMGYLPFYDFYENPFAKILKLENIQIIEQLFTNQPESFNNFSFFETFEDFYKKHYNSRYGTSTQDKDLLNDFTRAILRLHLALVPFNFEADVICPKKRKTSFYRYGSFFSKLAYSSWSENFLNIFYEEFIHKNLDEVKNYPDSLWNELVGNVLDLKNIDILEKLADCRTLKLRHQTLTHKFLSNIRNNDIINDDRIWAIIKRFEPETDPVCIDYLSSNSLKTVLLTKKSPFFFKNESTLILASKFLTIKELLPNYKTNFPKLQFNFSKKELSELKTNCLFLFKGDARSNLIWLQENNLLGSNLIRVTISHHHLREFGNTYNIPFEMESPPEASFQLYSLLIFKARLFIQNVDQNRDNLNQMFTLIEELKKIYPFSVKSTTDLFSRRMHFPVKEEYTGFYRHTNDSPPIDLENVDVYRTVSEGINSDIFSESVIQYLKLVSLFPSCQKALFIILGKKAEKPGNEFISALCIEANQKINYEKLVFLFKCPNYLSHYKTVVFNKIKPVIDTIPLLKLVASDEELAYYDLTKVLDRKSYFQNKNFKEIVTSFFGRCEPSLVKTLSNIIVNHSERTINTDWFWIGLLFKNCIKDINRLVTLLPKIAKNNDFVEDIDYSMLEQYGQFLGLYSEERVQILLSKDFTVREIQDSFRTYVQIKNKGTLPESPRTIKELHDSLTREYTRLKDAEYELNQLQNFPILKRIHKKQVKDLLFLVPKTHHQLIRWGTQMGNCIGTYANKARNKNAILIGIFRNKTLVCNIEISPALKIVQMEYRFKNSYIISAEDKSLIIKALTDRKIIDSKKL